jgi:hypothetical protein
MRNKIPCSAQKISQLQPDMIQSVVGAQVFQLGREYQAANCVQILEADEDQILSEVNGPFGLYEQTIQLKSGNLLTKCSCTSNEQPFCRHCVAVLLGYQRQAGSRDVNRFTEPDSSAEPAVAENKPASPVTVNLHHITIFIDWVQKAVQALDKGQALPEPPALDPGDVMAWVRGIQNLHARWRLSEDKRTGLEAELLKREAQLDRLLAELEAFPREANEAQATCETMQHGLANCRVMLSRLAEITMERQRLEEQIRSTTDDLLKKGSDLNSLAASLKEVSGVIQEAAGSAVH